LTASHLQAITSVNLNEEQVVLDEEIGHVRVVTLNSPRKLNIITSKVVSRLAELYEKWENENGAEL